MNAVENESTTRCKYLAPAQNLFPDFSRRSEGKDTLRVYSPAPEDKLIPKVRFQLLGVHSSSGALHRIEDVEPGLDEGRQKPGDRTAGMLEGFPFCVRMNPIIDLFVVWEIQVIEGLHGTE
jgi:hypothetical protein